MIICIPCLATSALTLAALTLGATISINPPATAPSTAAGPIDHAFVGFGIEAASLPDYAGNTSHPNTFSAQLISNIQNKTGAPVQIRVGGTSLDNAKYIPSQTEAIVYPSGQQFFNVPIGITFGPEWFNSFSALPAVKWILDVPLEFSSVDASVQFAQAGVQAITIANLQAIEIGNEPNFYNDNTETIANYVSAFQNYSAAITSSVPGLSSLDPIYQGATVASGAPLPPWDASTLFTSGLGSLKNIKSVSYHYYQTTYGHNISTTLLNHTLTTTTLRDTFQPSLSYLSSGSSPKLPSGSPIPFVLGEVGSSLNTDASNGTQLNDFPLESVLGAAIWTVDFLLYALSLGVGRVSMQQIRGAAYDGWQPAPLLTQNYGTEQPAVLPPYYGYLFAADFIGTSSDVRVEYLPLPASPASANASAYAAYDAGALARVAVLNTQFWIPDSGVARPVLSVSLAVPSGVGSVRVDKLSAGAGAGAESEGGLSWRGLEYSFASGGAGVPVDESAGNRTVTVGVQGGQVVLEVPAVEAWLVTLLG